MPLMTWELWLARDIVADNPQPLQKSQAKLTPGRVAQAMGFRFSDDWHSRPTTKTPWKVSRVADRGTTTA